MEVCMGTCCVGALENSMSFRFKMNPTTPDKASLLPAPPLSPNHQPNHPLSHTHIHTTCAHGTAQAPS
jgi:hypothetical protein